ncbi:hypothetical protein PQE68_gp251 [Bacillus phage vB_BanS_Sophrita]|uniref:Uncharacterized protein n=2 Tax=Sophritavirus TaxID=3044834 RepID=A0A3T0IHP4_9CAUD|nr:hypothetical protein PQE68_gp251 [Bacillus phage vB_BanS_Sophrita]YP_010680067.1 hypothetical protein PQE69_gp165 [Bacillus phage pW2]AZU98953.1 hypothetical protein pW2_121 [Bacillus phage pW2]UGO50831.1 hypothetical protein SOPHRITA_244 [Bacillus phage vB_BanS_Sophrita]
MTTMTISKGVSFTELKSIVEHMNLRNLTQIFPNKISNAKLRHEAIIELIVDEEGTVFAVVEGNSEPIMFPQLATVC